MNILSLNNENLSFDRGILALSSFSHYDDRVLSMTSQAVHLCSKLSHQNNGIEITVRPQWQRNQKVINHPSVQKGLNFADKITINSLFTTKENGLGFSETFYETVRIKPCRYIITLLFLLRHWDNAVPRWQMKAPYTPDYE